MAQRLTKRTVDRLLPGQVIWDSKVSGFGVRCQHSAAVRTYVLKTRVKGRQVLVTIGRHGSPWTVDNARAEALKLLGRIKGGEDPVAEKRAGAVAPTFREWVQIYRADELPKVKPRTQKEYGRLIDRHLLPSLGPRRVAEIARPDVERLHQRLRRTPRQANHAIAVLSRLLNRAEARGFRPNGSNPCRHLERFSENARSRYPSDQELTEIGKALSELRQAGKITEGTALAVRLAIMTGLRMSEILGLRWSDVDFAVGELHIREAKAGARIHPIGAAVVLLLKAARRGSEWVVWNVDPGRPMPQPTLEHKWHVIREKAGLSGLRFHDLRHGYGTYAGQAGANAFLVRDAMGHKTLAMTSRYVARDTNPVKRLADTVSARATAALDNMPTTNVAELAERRHR